MGLDKDSIQKGKKDFVRSTGLTNAEAEELRKTWGRNELEEKTTPKWLLYLQQLYQPMPIMIWIAIIVEGAIQNWADFGILLGIQFVNATLGWYETIKAGDAVAALKAQLKPKATVKRDGTWQIIDGALLVPGDLVLVGSGSAIPADVLINHGQIDVDQSALTGESLPVNMYEGDHAKMGSTITRGETEATVESTGKNTFLGKTATMLQNADGLGHLQKILLTIMVILVVISIVLCGTAFGYLLGIGEDGVEALSFTVVLLVASIPIAIEIVCTTTLALGSRQLSAHGAIVTRLAAIEDMAGMNMLCSDKTGTLTLNKMVIQDDCPTYQQGEDRYTVLRHAALAAKWHEPPRDALDTLVLTAADIPSLDPEFEQIDFLPFDPTIKRTEGTIKRKDNGFVFKVTKGAPHVILKLLSDADRGQVEQAVEYKVQELGERGVRSLAVARTDAKGAWQMLGILTFLDPPRPDTKQTIIDALKYGVDVKMITGDHTVIAKETARAIGLGTNIFDAKGLPTMDADGRVPKDLGKNYGEMILQADGFAQVFPEHKYLIVEALRQNGFAVGMTGDGVNDAPALKRADVGIAVSGSTDAARAAADIVLTEEGLSTVITGIVVARCIFQRMKNFINYRIAATLQLLIFFFIAVFALKPHDYEPIGPDGESLDHMEWPHFFKLPVIMLMLITLLNDGTLISIGYDHVTPSPRPDKWNLRALFCVSIVLGGIACVSSLILLWAALDSWNPDGLFRRWNLPTMHYSAITSMIYLKVSISDFLTLFSARTHEGFFWSTRPSPLLLGAALLALGISTILACLWPDGKTDGVPTAGLDTVHYKLWPLWVWIYCVIWWFIQDACKVLTYRLMLKFDIFQLRTGKMINLRDAEHPDDQPLARSSIGMVETKRLNQKVEDATAAVVLAASDTREANLARMSADVEMMHSRHEAGELPMSEVITAVEELASKLPPNKQAEVEPQLHTMRTTADELEAVKHEFGQDSSQVGQHKGGRSTSPAPKPSTRNVHAPAPADPHV